MLKKNFLIINETGLHARPATKIVNAAGSFESDIKLIYNNQEIDLKSIIGVLSLGIYVNENISIKFDGSDEVNASNKISELLFDLGIAKEVL